MRRVKMKQSKVLNLALIAALLITTIVFIGGCYPAQTPAEGEGGGFNWTIIIFLVLIFAIFYFLMIRPQRKKQKEQQELMQGLQKGDRVITVGGIYGQIENLDEESVVLKLESGATIRVARGSIAGKREK
jgi:preprotein translocase subunit YajC